MTTPTADRLHVPIDTHVWFIRIRIIVNVSRHSVIHKCTNIGALSTHKQLKRNNYYLFIIGWELQYNTRNMKSYDTVWCAVRSNVEPLVVNKDETVLFCTNKKPTEKKNEKKNWNFTCKEWRHCMMGWTCELWRLKKFKKKKNERFYFRISICYFSVPVR